MKLIDLLVQELPKRGGWPDGKGCITCSISGKVFAHGKTIFVTSHVLDESSVDKEQYESALNKPVWSGEGLPPVGVECEYSLNSGGTWHKCKIDYILGTQGLIMLADVFEGAQYVPFFEYDEKLLFRPIRSEADKKRDESLRVIYEILDAGTSTKQDAADIYDAIAACKIPGVKLED